MLSPVSKRLVKFSLETVFSLTRVQTPVLPSALKLCRLQLRHRLAFLKYLVNRVFGEGDVFDLVSIMTLLLLLLHIEKDGHLRIPITVLGVLGILYRPLTRKATYWFVITLVLALGHSLIWHLIDNHKYLMTYWCLALGCSLLAPNPLRALALNARLLIGLCFFFAVLWKVISADFLDGSFFHFTFLTDPRFRGVAEVIGGMPSEVSLKNEQVISNLNRFDSTLVTVQLRDTPRLIRLAQLFTWWTVAIEGLIALMFLWPEGTLISRWRDLALILFVLSTYSVATVVGFGWLLIVMGLAQAAFMVKYSRPLYLVMFLFLPIYEIPFSKLYLFAMGHLHFMK